MEGPVVILVDAPGTRDLARARLHRRALDRATVIPRTLCAREGIHLGPVRMHSLFYMRTLEYRQIHHTR
jgi:hypothetical protein